MIYEPITVGGREIRNRLVMPPVATYQATEDGRVTDKMLAYYGARAKGGRIGIIYTEHAYVAMQGKAKARQMSVSDDGDIEGLGLLAQTIKKDGSIAILQMNHAGSASLSEVTGMPIVSASSVILPVKPVMGDGTVPMELTRDEIDVIAEKFAAAARRAKEAGFDGVEIHSAHAYLLNQFFSPLTNQRIDEYGGNLQNRVRFHLEIIEAVRKAVGKEFIISLRLGGCDYADGGSSISDAAETSRLFEQAGIDMISITGGMCRYTRPGHDEPGYFAEISSAVKQAVTIPVLLTGGVKTISEARTLLESGCADMIGVGRELLKNPGWPEDM